MRAKFTIDLDGLESAMITMALLEKAKRLEMEPLRGMYKALAARIEAEKVAFHARTYEEMRGRYELPGGGE